MMSGRRGIRNDDLQRVYAIGDIHGRLDLLLLLEALIAEDLEQFPVERPGICYLGDYIDRGPDSRGVIDHLARPPEDGIERICLLGNHEDRFLGFLADPMLGEAWFGYGAAAAMASYGVDAPERPSFSQLERLQKTLALALPEPHRHFLENLALSLSWQGYLFVHAGIRPGRPPEDQDPHDLIWIRDPFLSSTENFGLRIVHGHAISAEPEVKPNRIGIDTGAYRSGRLTALAADPGKFRFLQSLTPSYAS